MVELCATHFAALNPKQVVVANRTLERADLLASRFVAKTMKLSDIPEKLADFDVIVSCTASTLPILGLGMVERATRSEEHTSELQSLMRISYAVFCLKKKKKKIKKLTP